MTALTEQQLSSELDTLKDWKVESGKLTTTRQLPTFPDAIAFVQRVGEVAEELNHHPDIDIRWRKVTLSVCTHDAGDAITQYDVQLARRVDAL